MPEMRHVPRAHSREKSRVKAIFTKYIGPSNVRGARVKATDEDRNSVTLSWDHALDSLDNHRAAAEALIKKMKWNPTRIVPGSLKAGYVWTMLDYRPGHPVETFKVNPIKGPGKFEGETYAARYAYENPDEDLGDSETFGWYGRFSGKIKGRGPFFIIVEEQSQGFVTGTFFDTEKQLEKAWARIEREWERENDLDGSSSEREG